MLGKVQTPQLQDEAVLPPSPPVFRNTRILILFLLFTLAATLILMVYLKYSSRPVEIAKTMQQLETAATPLPPTGTFVDALIGTVVYYNDGKLIDYTLPDRTQKQIVGVDEKLQLDFPKSSVVWSLDGSIAAFITPNDKIAITNYDTGKLVAVIALPHHARPEQLVPSISVDNQVLAVGIRNSDEESKSSLHFFDVLSGSLITSYENCRPVGTFSSIGFYGSCSLGDISSVVLIQFDETSSSMIAIAKESKNRTYQVLSLSSDSGVYVEQKIGTASQMGILSPNGVFSPISRNQLAGVINKDILKDPVLALRKRIETLLEISGVEDVSVSSDGSWMVYESRGKLYIADTALQETPYEIGEGSLPRIRPY